MFVKQTPPFTQVQMDEFDAAQQNSCFHGYTCIDHSQIPLKINQEGLYCEQCDYKQTWFYYYWKDEA